MNLDERAAADEKAIGEARLAHDAVAVLRVKHGDPNLPMAAVFRRPKKIAFKRFSDLISKAEGAKEEDKGRLRIEATEALARACWLYPTDEKERGALEDEAPTLLAQAGAAAAELLQKQVTEEGKD